MITVETLCVRVTGVTPEDLERWIDSDWVRPEGLPGQYRFTDIDVARVALIVELRRDMRVNDEALPVVLSLLDQLYAARRQMRRVKDVLRAVPPEARHPALAALFKE